MKKPSLPKPKPVETKVSQQAATEDKALQQRRSSDQLAIAKGLAGPRALLGKAGSGYRGFFA